jgi:hypothetical protein
VIPPRRIAGEDRHAWKLRRSRWFECLRKVRYPCEWQAVLLAYVHTRLYGRLLRHYRCPWPGTAHFHVGRVTRRRLAHILRKAS